MIRRGALLALGALAACGPPAPTVVSGEPPPPAWRVRGPGGLRGIELGTADPDLVDAERCGACHAEIAAEWRGSRHGLAWTNGLFQREYQEAPKPWCVNCHAPTPPQQAELAAGGHRLADQGVSCATCHVRGGRLVAARRAAASPHATVVDPTFGSPAFCADCHDFTFPVLAPDGVALALTPHPMQSTVTSFAAGPYAAEPDGCLTCHGSRHGHAFPGGHAPDMLAGAYDVAWCRRGAALEVELTNAAAGHRVPTGDIHRHLLLRVWRSSAPAGVFEAFFGRRFELAADGGKRTVWDSGLDPRETRRFTVDLAALADGDADAEPDEPLNLELVYVFIADEFPRRDRVPTEPGTATIVRWRTPPAAIDACR
ncbi:MAG: hypothetical protein IPL61_31395 [Myxococcales bacterium]|nr:hypothetical protein [Myxococcales bacterium]